MTIEWSLLLVPLLLAMLVTLLSFAGCTVIVEGGRPEGPILLSFSYDPKKVTLPVERVVFYVRRPIVPGHSVLPESVVVLKHQDQLVWGFQPLVSNSGTYTWAADKGSGAYRASASDALKGPVGLDWRVGCRAYPNVEGDDDPYPEAEQLLQPGQGELSDADIEAWHATQHEFHFTLGDAEPFQVIGAPRAMQRIVKQPDVHLQFTRSAAMKMQRVMKVGFRIAFTTDGGSTYDIVETIVDLETHALHVENSLWKVFPSVTWDEAGSNDTGVYGMSIRNAPPGKWSVTCEAYDSKTSTTATYQTHPTDGTVELDVGSVEPPTSHQFRFKFKLERMAGTGLGFTVVADRSP